MTTATGCKDDCHMISNTEILPTMTSQWFEHVQYLWIYLIAINVGF